MIPLKPAINPDIDFSPGVLKKETPSQHELIPVESKEKYTPFLTGSEVRSLRKESSLSGLVERVLFFLC